MWKRDGATRSATTERQEESHSAVSHPVVNKFSRVNRCELTGWIIYTNWFGRESKVK